MESRIDILVVDDENAKKYASCLSGLGSVEIAVNAEEAIQKALQLKPRVVSLDNEMPESASTKYKGFYGNKVARKLKQELPGINIIALSSATADLKKKNFDLIINKADFDLLSYKNAIKAALSQPGKPYEFGSEDIAEMQNKITMPYCTLDLLIQGYYAKKDSKIFEDFTKEFGKNYFSGEKEKARKTAEELVRLIHESSFYSKGNRELIDEKLATIVNFVHDAKVAKLCQAVDNNNLEEIHSYCKWHFPEEEMPSFDDKEKMERWLAKGLAEAEAKMPEFHVALEKVVSAFNDLIEMYEKYEYE